MKKRGYKVFPPAHTVPDGNIPNQEIASYSIGMFGQNLVYGMMTAWLLYFCTDVLYMDAMVAGSILAISRVWDGINDPLVGALLDRTRFKNGEKFRPLLKIVPIPMAIISILIFTDFHQAETANVIAVLVLYLLWDTVYSFQDTAMWSMSSVMSPHSHERSRLIQWMQIAGSAAAGLTGIGGAITLFLSFKDKLGLSQSAIFFIAALIFMGGGSLLTFFCSKGKERVRTTKVEQNIFKNLGIALKNKMLLLLILAWILSAVMPILNNTYFFRYLVSFEFGGTIINGEQAMVIQGAFFTIPGFLGMLLARKLSDKLGGMRNMVIFSCIVNIVVRVLAFFVGYQTFPQFVFLTVMLLITNTFAGTIGIAVSTLWGDSVDYGEWKTGVRTEGIAFSMKNFVAKINSAIQSLIAGGLLSILQYDAKLEMNQPKVFTDWLWPIYILGPIVASVLMLIPMFILRYPRELQDQIETELIERRGVIVEE